jgi:Mg-chelatase subunit ChlD
MDDINKPRPLAMSSPKTLIDSMDKYIEKIQQTPLLDRLGENGHAAYTWSTSMKEKMTQVFFQLTRITKDPPINVIDEYGKMVREIYTKDMSEMQSLCVKMITQTRDVIDGKGEYDLTYKLLLEFALSYQDGNCCVDKTKHVLYYLVNPLPIEGNEHPYGSWKDLKKFMDYVRIYKEQLENPTECYVTATKKDICNELIAYCMNLYVIQLKNDVAALMNGELDKLSLCAKWVPREKSKYNWIFTRLASTIFYCEESPLRSDYSYTKQTYRKFRKLIASLNRAIDTLEIKQCGNRYREIEFSKVPSVAMTRQTKAFMNIKNNQQRSLSDDRTQCATKFTAYINELSNGKTKVNAKRNNITDLVENVFYATQMNDSEKKLIDAQWNEFVNKIGDLPEMVAMVDVSGSMTGVPMIAAIGLGLCIATKSRLGPRVLTFDENPTWVNLDDCNGSFEKMVNKIKQSNWGTTTNFYKAAQLMLDRIIENKLSANEASNMILVVLSDMQINTAVSQRGGGISSMMDNIKDMYRDAGLKTCGKPYDPPHIVFWNLSSTQNFPNLSSTENTTMLSGYSPQMLNAFIQHGVEGLKEMSPYKMMEQMLSNPRYDIETFIEMEKDWILATSNKYTKSHREFIKTNAGELC